METNLARRISKRSEQYLFDYRAHLLGASYELEFTKLETDAKLGKSPDVKDLELPEGAADW